MAYAIRPLNSRVLQRESLDIAITCIFTQPTSLRVLYALTIDGGISYFLPIDVVAEPLATKEMLIDFDAIRTGEVVGSGAAGTVYKTKYLGQEVAVKKVCPSHPA